MPYPAIHSFLKWAGPTLVVFGGAVIGLVATVAQAFPDARPWAEGIFYQWWPVVASPWFFPSAAVAICAYIAALLWTGRPPRAHRSRVDLPVPESPPGPPWFDASGCRYDIGEYGRPPASGEIDAIGGAIAHRIHGQSDRRQSTPDVAATGEAKRRNRSKSVAGKLSAREKWLPLDQAVLYLARASQWGQEQDQCDPHFSINVSLRLQDALACGDLTARGRKFHLLKGGIKEPPLYPLTPLGMAFWEQARINAYWPLAGTAPNIGGQRVENVVRKGDHEGMHDVLVNQHQLEALWPPPRNDLDAPRIPFASLRDLAIEYGLNLDHRHPAASNLAYKIEGEIKAAAANNRFPVWGRPYNGAVRDNDPLVPIPPEHFLKYSIRHGALHHVIPNSGTCTTTMHLVAEGKAGVEGETFYDLHVSTLAARAILERLANENAVT